MATVREKFDQVNTKFGEIASELLAKQDKDGDKQLTADDFVANSTHLGLRAGGTQKTDVGLGSLENYGIASKDDADMGLASDKKLTPKKNKDHSLSKISFGAVAPDNNDGKPDGTLHFQAGEWSLIFVKHNGEYREIKDFWFKHNGVWVNKYVPNIRMAGEWIKMQARKVSLIKYGFLYNEYAGVDVDLPNGYRVLNFDDSLEMIGTIESTFGTTDRARRLKHRKFVNSPLGEPWATSEHPRWDASSSGFGLDNFLIGMLPAGRRNISRVYEYFGTRAVIRRGWYSWFEIRNSHTDNMSFIQGGASASSLTALGYSQKLVRDATLNEQALPNGTLLEQVEDGDGNVYDTVKVGSLLICIQFHASTKDSNGNPLHLSTGTSSAANTTPAYARPNDQNGNSHFANEEESIWKPELMIKP